MDTSNLLPQTLTPTAYQIGQYGRTPVSYFHGLPQISVPLTEVCGRGITIPVSLSYHGGGIKAEQHPGWVGLGWSLQAGGCITRVVNGIKDEMSASEYGHLHNTYPSTDPGYLHHSSDIQDGPEWTRADLTNGVSYDACGRYTGSSGSVVSTSYNEIGQPLEMTLSDGSMVRTVYAADGRKLRETTVLSGTSATRSYSGSCIFEGNTLKKVLFEGGYAQMNGSTPSYMFFLTDHLGSVRVVAAQNADVKQVNQYYPFGDLIADSHVTAGTSDNRYRFIGKEFGERTGLYDFSARYLETSMGRFTTIDPLAEKYPSVSPYVYCAGDPVNLVDLDGRDARIHYNADSKTITVTSKIYIYGTLATNELAANYEKSLRNTWGSFGTTMYEGSEYTIHWNLSVSVMNQDQKKDYSTGENNYFEVSETAATSSVKNKHVGIIRPIVNNNNDMIHEFGHILGLKDRYIKIIEGGRVEYSTQENYEGNIMAAEAGMGIIEPQNLTEALQPFFDAGMPSTFILNIDNGQK